MWVVEVVVPPVLAPAAEAAVARCAEAVSTFAEDDDRTRRIAGYARAQPDVGALRAALARVAARRGIAAPRVRVACLPPTDWVADVRERLPPVDVGRYAILGTHEAGRRRPGRTVLRLDAGLAFGSGRHESTRGCLLAVDLLARGRAVGRALDLGCGSGVLALAVARTWRRPVLAVDIDPLAAAAAADNARRNGLAPWVRTLVADGAAPRAVRRAGPFDLITANILAGPLRRLAGDMVRVLAPRGTLVLSGFLTTEEAGVLAVYRARGLRLVRRLHVGAWATLVLEEGRSPRPGTIRRAGGSGAQAALRGESSLAARRRAGGRPRTT